MSDQTPMHPIMALLCGLATVGFLALLGWVLAHLILNGIPESDRADLASTAILAGVGLAVSVIAGARLSGGQNPLDALSAGISALRGLFRR